MFLLFLLVACGEALGDDALASDIHCSSKTSFPPSYPSCFTEETTWSTEEVIDILTEIQSLYFCQDLCLQSPNCLEFTWYNSQAIELNFTCFLYEHTTTEHPCTNCISGPQSCTCDTPDPQKHGDWFCPPLTGSTTCHLECDPGYVSDNGTVITCYHGEWSSAPTCVAAVALITGNDNYVGNTVEIYGEGLHKKLPDLPYDRYRHSLDLVNSAVLLCGGVHTQTSCLALTSFHQWIRHSSTTSARYCHSSVSMLGKLQLLGGAYSPSTTEYLAPPSDQWHHSWDLLETSWAGCTAKIAPEMLIVTGGYDHRGSVVSHNVTSGVATRLQDLIVGRGDHGCIYVKEHGTGFRGVLVAGGYDGKRLSSSEMYDITTGKWSTTGELTTGRKGVRMVVLGDNVLAMGGHDGATLLSSVDRFNLTSKLWTAAENMLEVRYLHAVTGVLPSAVGFSQK